MFQLLEPCFQQREKEESMQGENDLDVRLRGGRQGATTDA